MIVFVFFAMFGFKVFFIHFLWFEVVRSKNITLLKSIKNIKFLPQFKIENLPSGSEFKVNVFARNEKGISDKTEVDQYDVILIHLDIVLHNIEISLYF